MTFKSSSLGKFFSTQKRDELRDKIMQFTQLADETFFLSLGMIQEFVGQVSSPWLVDSSFHAYFV